MITNFLLNAAPTDSLSILHRIDGCFDSVLGNIHKVSDMFTGLFYMNTANHIAAFCVLFYLGYEMWPVIMGQKSPDILKLIRPILIGIVISAWPMFYMNFYQMKENLADGPKTMYKAARGDLFTTEQIMDKKIAKMDSVTSTLFHASMADLFYKDIEREKELELRRSAGQGGRSAETGGEGYNGGSNDGGGGVRGGDYDETTTAVDDIDIDEDDFKPDGHHNKWWESAYMALTLMEFELSRILEFIIQVLGSIILQCYVCGLMLISELGTTFIGMFGPIFFALSLTNVFRNHWAKWIEKYVCFALYPFIAYLIMTFLTFLIIDGMDKQINMITLDKPEDFEAFLAASKLNFGIMITYLLPLFVGSYCMHSVPELANKIMPGGNGDAGVGAGQFISGMVMTIIGGATRTVIGAGATVLSAGAAAAGAGAGIATNYLGGSGGGVEHDQRDNGDNAKSSGGLTSWANDGSKDPKPKRKKNDLDGYSKYNPFGFLFGSKKKEKNTDGESFEYKRSSKKTNKGGGYNPKANNHHVRRGRHIELDSWYNRNLAPKKIKQKTRHLWNNSLQMLSFVLADENEMGPQSWATAIKGVKEGAKKGVKSTLAAPSAFAYHFKKHRNNGTYQAINHWQKERNSDMVFVRRPAVGGYAYQTYGEEAANLARLTGEKVKYVKVGKQKVAVFTLYKHNLQPVIHRLNEMGLSVNVIDTKGKSVYYKQDISYSKQNAINRIKDVLKKNNGDIRFNKAVKDMHVEPTGDGQRNIGKKKGGNLSIDVLGIMADIYGALHFNTKDENGNSHTTYLDRLKEEDLRNLADKIEEMDNLKEGFSVVPIDGDDESLDNVHDDNEFSASEDAEYSRKSAQNRQEGGSETETEDKVETETSENLSPKEQTYAKRAAHKEFKDQLDQENQKPTINITPIDPLKQLKTDTTWVNKTPLTEMKNILRKGGKGFVTLIGGGVMLVLSATRPTRWMMVKSANIANKVSSFFGWNDKTRPDMQKDIRAGVEYKWMFRVAVKENQDYRKRQRILPLSISAKRRKVQTITRGRGIHFAGVDFRNRTGVQKIANCGWRLTKWTTKAAYNTARYAIGVATFSRPIISISSLGSTGFKATYNGVRYMARKVTARNAVIAWKRENRHNYAIVRRRGVSGTTYQTYGEDAVAIARILHKQNQVKVLKLSTGESFNSGRFFDKNVVPSLTLTIEDMKRLNAIIQQRGLTMDVISTNGKSLLKPGSALAAAIGIHQQDADTTNSNPTNSSTSSRTNTSGFDNPSMSVNTTNHDDNPSVSDDTINQEENPSSGVSDNPNTAESKPSTDDKKPEPIVLNYQPSYSRTKAKTFQLKDKDGNIIYIVTGESLRSILEKMVRDGHSLKGLNLMGEDLRDINLKEANLSEAILTGANLRGAKLQKANLTNADLTKASLRVANLYKANLTGANLMWTDMREANVKKAIMPENDIDSADGQEQVADSSNNNSNNLDEDTTGPDDDQQYLTL